MSYNGRHSRLLYLIYAYPSYLFFFFNDTATTEIYTLSLHDALPISRSCNSRSRAPSGPRQAKFTSAARDRKSTSELQSRLHLVCRLLLEKKKKQDRRIEDR